MEYEIPVKIMEYEILPVKIYGILDDMIQVRDEYRTDFDSGRGGYGKIVQQKLETPDSLM